MRRGGLLVLGWVVAGATALVASQFGVSLIADQVTGDRPAPLSAAEIRDELALSAAAADTAPPAAPATTTTPETTVPTVPSGATGTAPATPPPDGGAPTPTAPPPTTAPPAAGGQVLTHQAIGGTVTLRYAPEGVTVLAATPAAGFAVTTQGDHGNGIRVTFEGDEHRTRITGWWDDGPRTEVREDD